MKTNKTKDGSYLEFKITKDGYLIISDFPYGSFENSIVLSKNDINKLKHFINKLKG